MNDVKEEIRDRLDIEVVIGDYLELKRAGRNFKALSPFSNEKTPSFIVSPDKRIWHDFSSGKGGDIYSFIMEMEGVDFKEALKILARKAGVELKQYNNGRSQAVARQKKDLIKINQLASKFFQAVMNQNQHALDYAIKKRRLNKQTIKDFAIGYAPNNGKALVAFLQKRGFKLDQIVKAGLTNQYKSDLFKSRLMIPLSDAMGQVIGFTGRGLKKETIPKYLNTPSTLIYDKSSHVFGLFQAKESIRKLNQVVIVEGNMDVISSHQAGVRQVVATAGTAMTAQHLKMLKRYSSDIRLAFDADQAGIKAVERAIELAQEIGVDLKIVTLVDDEAKDPDELIQKSVKLWQQSIDQAQPAVTWLMDGCKSQFDLTTATGKRDYAQKILKTIDKIADPIEKETYLQKLTDLLGVKLEILRQQLDRPEPAKRRKGVRSELRGQADSSRHQDDLLALGLISSAVRQLLKEIDPQIIFDVDNKKRRQMLQYLLEHDQELEQSGKISLQELAEYGKVLALKTEQHYLSWSKNDLISEGKRLIDRIETEFRQQGKDKLMAQLKQAELIGDDKEFDRLLAEINQMTKGVSNAKDKHQGKKI